jgi:Flp pilus assembly protein TadG
MRHRNGERGSQTLEFTMVGIPLIFILFSIANMCFSMLTLHTLQEAVEQGARYTVTRGSSCQSPNSCAVKVQDIAGVIAGAAPGISKSSLQVTLTTASGAATPCNPVSACLASCSTGCSASRTSTWPPAASGDSAPGKDIVITADCALTAPMFMFWPGAGSTKISSTHFYANSRQQLMF